MGVLNCGGSSNQTKSPSSRLEASSPISHQQQLLLSFQIYMAFLGFLPFLSLSLYPTLFLRSLSLPPFRISHFPFPIFLSLALLSFVQLIYMDYMMKKPRRVVMESSPSSSSAGLFSVPVREEGRAGGFSPIPVAVCEDARARYKHQVLLQDYEELLKETQAKKKKLQKVAQKKFQLTAEVKFLRRKFRSFAKKPTQETPYRLKKQSHRMPSPSLQLVQPRDPMNRIEFPSKDAQGGLKETAVPRTCGLLDLNQISLPTAEEMQEFPMEWGASKADKLNRFPVEGDAMANDFKHSVVRDVGNSSSNVGKRKISWQDQVALWA